MKHSFFLFSVVPFYRAIIFLPLLMGLLGLTIYIQMSMHYVAGAPLEFLTWGLLAFLMLCVRCHFTVDTITITLFGITLKTWEGERFTTRPEKKLHRVFEKNSHTGELEPLPLLLNHVPFCLYEFKEAK